MEEDEKRGKEAVHHGSQSSGRGAETPQPWLLETQENKLGLHFWISMISVDIVNLFLKDKIWLTLILSSFSLALRSLRIWNWSLNHIPLHFARALSRTSLRIVTKTWTGLQETDTDTHSLKRMINRNCDASRTCFREKNKQIKFANYNKTSSQEELQNKKYILKIYERKANHDIIICDIKNVLI